MNINDALVGVSRLFLDTAPVIYFVERNPHFVNLIDPIFELLEAEITAVVSGVTLAECLSSNAKLNIHLSLRMERSGMKQSQGPAIASLHFISLAMT